MASTVEREQIENGDTLQPRKLFDARPAVPPAAQPCSSTQGFDSDANQSEQITVAEIVSANPAETRSSFASSVPLPVENHAATGGAVAGLALGVWSIITAFITPWSVINALLGFILAIWGVQSPRTRTAITGLVLCVIGAMLAMTNLPLLLRGRGQATPLRIVPNSEFQADTFDQDNSEL